MGMIRQIEESEYSEAIATVWKVFLKYNAPTYSADGVYNFRKFLTDEQLFRLFCNGDYPIFASFSDNDMSGVVSLRNENHISLLFVSEEWQGKGIATRLLEYLCDYCRNKGGLDYITVNSSPYAEGFYHHFGFRDTDELKFSDGITYTPMIFYL